MGSVNVIDSLGLPSSARVDKRIPKKLLLEQGVSTAADRRHIQDFIEEMQWVAALKPNNIGVQEYRDEVRHYQEIAVLIALLRSGKTPTRLAELIHRSIPYPVFLISEQGDAITISLAHKRWSQGEAGKVVIDEFRRTAPFLTNALKPEETQFLRSLAISSLPAQNLLALYQGWLDRICALEAAMISGSFLIPTSMEDSIALHEGLQSHTQLKNALVTLRAQAKKEKQINRRAAMNMEIKRLETRLATVADGFKRGEIK